MEDRPALNDVIEITPEMIEAGVGPMATFDPDFGTWAEGVERVLEAALVAGGYLRERDG